MLNASKTDGDFPKSLAETIARHDDEQTNVTRLRANRVGTIDCQPLPLGKDLSPFSRVYEGMNPQLGKWAHLPVDVAPLMSYALARPLFLVHASAYRAGRNERQLNDETAPRNYTARPTGAVKFMQGLSVIWELSASEVTALLGFEDSQVRIVKNILSGHTSLAGQDAKARVSVLFDIRKRLAALLQSDEVERRWLRENRDLLDDRSALELMTRSFEGLLEARDYIFHISRQ